MIWLSCFQAKPLLAARAPQPSTPDLGRTWVEVTPEAAGVRFPTTLVPWAVLQRIAEEERKVFLWDGEEATQARVFSETTGWVRTLCPTETAPTVLVSGIPMHRIKDMDPLRDTAAKLKALGAPKGRVLDTATGLGYTAIAAGCTATEVVTVELDDAALEIAKLNPWSRELFETPNIRQLVADVGEAVRGMESGCFGAIIHDPPTTALGGDLYSAAFYEQLYRLLSRGGRLYHYIGDPDSAHGKKTTQGVMRRLAEVGFQSVRREPQAFGVTATKRG